MKEREIIRLTRPVDAIVIPDGHKFILEEGTQVILQQSLGGSYTVTTDMGYMARIDGSDADALGKEPPKNPGSDLPAPKTEQELQERIWQQLRQCYDPEIPVNIVELGLIYEMKINTEPDSNFKVGVKMTLTAPGCGMGNVLQEDVSTRIKNIPGVSGVNVELVLDPPWTQDMMSEAARLELGL